MSMQLQVQMQMQMQTQHIRSQAMAQALQHQRLQSTQPPSTSSTSSSSSSNLMPHIGRVSTRTLNANGMVNLNAGVSATNTFVGGNGLRNGTMDGLSDNDPAAAAAAASMSPAVYSTLQMMGTPSGGTGVGGLTGSRVSPTHIPMQTQTQTQTPGSNVAISPGGHGGTGGKNVIVDPSSATTNLAGSSEGSKSSALRTTERVSATAVVDQVHASVSHLLTRAYSLPCSTAAQAFAGLVQPIARFQLALDALLPLLNSAKSVEVSSLFFLYVGS